jgi:hypothetical protein
MDREKKQIYRDRGHLKRLKEEKERKTYQTMI